jgi:hypothetical protein
MAHNVSVLFNVSPNVCLKMLKAKLNSSLIYISYYFVFTKILYIFG